MPLADAISKVAAAKQAALNALSTAQEAVALNHELRQENETLKGRLSANIAEYADAELLRDNEHLKQQVSGLQTQLMRAQEVTLVVAKVVDRYSPF